jgi:hypothetical protein
MKPQIIVGAFGIIRSERISVECEPAVILDLKSRVIFRSGLGRVLGIYLTPSLFRIVFLLSAVPCVATYEGLTEHLYGELEDGGADCPVAVIRLYVFRLRRLLRPLSISIKSEYGIGFELCDAPIPPAYSEFIGRVFMSQRGARP